MPASAHNVPARLVLVNLLARQADFTSSGDTLSLGRERCHRCTFSRSHIGIPRREVSKSVFSGRRGEGTYAFESYLMACEPPGRCSIGSCGPTFSSSSSSTCANAPASATPREVAPSGADPMMDICAPPAAVAEGVGFWVESLTTHASSSSTSSSTRALRSRRFSGVSERSRRFSFSSLRFLRFLRSLESSESSLLLLDSDSESSYRFRCLRDDEDLPCFLSRLLDRLCFFL